MSYPKLSGSIRCCQVNFAVFGLIQHRKPAFGHRGNYAIPNSLTAGEPKFKGKQRDRQPFLADGLYAVSGGGVFTVFAVDVLFLNDVSASTKINWPEHQPVVIRLEPL